MENIESQKRYKKLKASPIDFILRHKLSFCYGNVIKYISRYKYKHGKDDLEKAITYCDYIRSLDFSCYEVRDYVISLYCMANDFPDEIQNCMKKLFKGDINGAIKEIKELIRKEYPDEN